MKHGLILTNVICHSCKLQANVVADHLVETAAEIEAIAERVHASTKLICLKPMIVAAYTQAMMSDELADAIAKAAEAVQAKALNSPRIITNGNGH